MKFTIQKTEFLRGLRMAQGIADRKSTMVMLGNVLLQLDGSDALQIRATDLNVSVSARLQSANQGNGGIAVGAKALHDIIAGLPGDSVEFTRLDNNWAEIKSGKVSYRLVGMPDRDFPKVPDSDGADFHMVGSTLLRMMLDSTMFSVSHDETRFHLNGILLESDGQYLRMVSTDGHRMSKVQRSIGESPHPTTGVIIPRKGCAEIKRLLELRSVDMPEAAVSVSIKPPYIFVRAGGGLGVTLAIKLIDRQFPPYEAVIPKSHTKEISVDRRSLLDAVKRAHLMSSETRGVLLSATPDSLVITSTNPDLGEAREELEHEMAGDSVAIGFNPKYMTELLSALDSDRVVIELNGELDPLVVRTLSGEGLLGVIMPMRV